MTGRLADTRKSAGCGGSSWRVSRGKQFREQGLLGTPGLASLHVGAAWGPGGSRPSVEGGPLAEVLGAGWVLEQVKVERIQVKVKVKRTQARVKG